MNKITLGVMALVLGLGIFSIHTTKVHAAAGHASLSILYGSDMQMGATGYGVAELQAYLGEQGYFTLPAGVNLGYFGAVTKAALARYQVSAGLAPSGYFGTETKDSIQDYLKNHCWLGACATL